LELRQYLTTVWKWWWLIVLSTALAAVCSYAATQLIPRVFQAQATVMVGQSTQSLNANYSDSVFAERLAQTYIQLATTQPVLQLAIDTLNLRTTPSELATRVNVSPVPNTQLLHIRVVDSDPIRAAATANGVAAALEARSPGANEPVLQRNRSFIETQLADLEKQIEEGRMRLPEMTAALDQVSSARALADRQAEIAAEETKISAWRATYASLLGFLGSSDTNTITIVDPAIPQSTPISPQARTNILLAGAMGLAIAVGAAFLFEYLDDTVKNAADVERVLGSGLLAGIARLHAAKPSDALVTLVDPASNLAEAYRLLRVNLEFSLAGKTKSSVLITSAMPGEGKTFTAANLAVSMALAGKRVILVDGDLRRPSVHRIFGVPSDYGLSNLLISDSIDAEACLHLTEVKGLRLLIGGPIPPNAAELLGSPRMDSVISRLSALGDLVLYDSPPILLVADTSLLASRIGQAILVVKAGTLRGDAAKRARSALDKASAKLLGVVLNQVPRAGASQYDYYRSYYTAATKPKHAARWRGLLKGRWLGSPES
jgi:capsular exopolysaccharide synthesis family protein